MSAGSVGDTSWNMRTGRSYGSLMGVPAGVGEDSGAAVGVSGPGVGAAPGEAADGAPVSRGRSSFPPHAMIAAATRNRAATRRRRARDGVRCGHIVAIIREGAGNKEQGPEEGSKGQGSG